MNYGDEKAVKKRIDKFFEKYKKDEAKIYQKIRERIDEKEYSESMMDAFRYQYLYNDLVKNIGKLLKKVKEADDMFLYPKMVGGKGYVTSKFRKCRTLKEESDKKLIKLYFEIPDKGMTATVFEAMLHKAVLKLGYLFRGEGELEEKNGKLSGHTGLARLPYEKKWGILGWDIKRIHTTLNAFAARRFGTGILMIIKTKGLDVVINHDVVKEVIFMAKGGIDIDSIDTVYVTKSEQYELAIKHLGLNGFKIEEISKEKNKISYDGKSFILASKKYNGAELDKFAKEHMKKVIKEFRKDILKIYKLANKYCKDKLEEMSPFDISVGRLNVKKVLAEKMRLENDFILMLVLGLSDECKLGHGYGAGGGGVFTFFEEVKLGKTNFDVLKMLKKDFSLELDINELNKSLYDYVKGTMP